MLEQRGLVVHIAQGSFEGTIAWIQNPASDVSSHFVVSKTGAIAQMVDSDTAAWTQREGNGHWLSVENEGFTPNPLTAAQVEANAQILAYGANLYKYPLTLAGSPAGRGLGYHSMGAEHGYNWGHSECPGPAIKNQLPAILARALEIAGGSPYPHGGTMPVIVAWPPEVPGSLCFSNGDSLRHIPDATALDQIQRGFPGITTVLDAAKWPADVVHKLYGPDGPAWGTVAPAVPLPGEDQIEEIAGRVARQVVAESTLTPPE